MEKDFSFYTPNCKNIIKHWEQKKFVTYEINSKGRRDQPNQVPNQKKIAFIGDSFTYGAMVPIEDNYNFYALNNILKKIPILRTIYSAIGQMTESFTKTDNKQKSVVLLEYPRKGIWAVGFATKDNEGEISEKTKSELVNVFVPTTPNPTSGFLLMFPKNEIKYLDMSFEEASRFIVSAGTSEKKKKN